MHKRPPRGAAVIVNRPDWPAPVRRDVLRTASDSARALQVKAVLAFGICAALVGLGAVYLALGVAADAGGESVSLEGIYGWDGPCPELMQL